MAKKKPETATAATAAPEPAPADKLYLHVCSPAGYSVSMSVMLPLTEVGKKTISGAIDEGNKAELITKEAFDLLRTSGDSLPQPSDEKHAEVCKICDYEPIVKKTIACSEYFDHVFTSEEIKQMAAEFSKSTARKTDLEDELKSHAQYLKSQITEVTATINRISQELGRGKRSENVKCHWIFNEPSRGQKSLYRLDTEPKELVRIAAMTASDKQMTLDDIAAAKQKTERTLEEKEVTPVTNEPYDGEVMTDAEVKEEIGVAPEVGEDPDDPREANTAEASDECPI